MVGSIGEALEEAFEEVGKKVGGVGVEGAVEGAWEVELGEVGVEMEEDVLAEEME